MKRLLFVGLLVLVIGCGKSTKEASQQEFLTDKAAYEVKEKEIKDLEASIDKMITEENKSKARDLMQPLRIELLELKKKMQESMKKATK